METPWITSSPAETSSLRSFNLLYFLAMLVYVLKWGGQITGNIPKLNICGPIPYPANLRIHLKTLGQVVLTAVRKVAVKLNIIFPGINRQSCVPTDQPSGLHSYRLLPDATTYFFPLPPQ